MYKFDGNSIKQNEISFSCELPSSSETKPTFFDEVVQNTCTLKNTNGFAIEEEKEEEKREIDSICPAFRFGKNRIESDSRTNSDDDSNDV